MNYKIYLKNRKELVIDGEQYAKLQDIILSNEAQMVKVPGGGIFNVADVRSVVPFADAEGERIKKDMNDSERREAEFFRQEEEYRNQSAIEKARREYYTRFMGMVLAVHGLRKVFGNDYASPATTKKAFDEGWDFTEEQRVDRRRRFDRWVEKSNWPTLWGSDLKSFLLEYFEQNPNKSWCDLEEWWPIFVEGKLPTTRFDRVLIAHESKRKVYDRH